MLERYINCKNLDRSGDPNICELLDSDNNDLPAYPQDHEEYSAWMVINQPGRFGCTLFEEKE